MSYRLHPTKNRDRSSNEKKWWQISYYPEGKKGGVKHLPFEGTEDDVRIAEASLRRRPKNRPLLPNPSLSAAVPDFMEHYRIERLPRSIESALLRLSHLTKFMGRFPLGNIDAKLVETYKKHRLAEGVKPITINKELNILSCVLKWSASDEAGPLIDDPLKVKLFPGKMTKSPIPIVPPSGDIDRIIEEIPSFIRGLGMLMFYGGLRRNEATHLEGEKVVIRTIQDGKRKVEIALLIVTGKGNKQRVVPVAHPGTVAELKRQKDIHPTGPLWPSPSPKNKGKPYKGILDPLKTAARRAGVEGRIYQHLLRHGFGTSAIESGIDLRSVQTLLGHVTSRTTEIYTHIAADHLIKQVQKFNTVLSGDEVEGTETKEENK